MSIDINLYIMYLLQRQIRVEVEKEKLDGKCILNLKGNPTPFMAYDSEDEPPAYLCLTDNLCDSKVEKYRKLRFWQFPPKIDNIKFGSAEIKFKDI